MKYRTLGKTGMSVSCIGLGCGMLGSSSTDYAVQIVQKALDLGVNYFDTARGYWDSEVKLGKALKKKRSEVYLSSKTNATKRDGAWQHIYESLERLQTGYLDNCHLHGLQDEADLDLRTGPGGALEALTEARDQGLIRHIGCTSHASRSILIEAIKRFDFEVILVPMNIVEREPLDKLIPLCLTREVGITIMKPLATGLVPAAVGLKWLLNQPISTAVPGASTVEEVTQNSLIGGLEDTSLSPEEDVELAIRVGDLEHVRCRLCGACEPCPVGIPIAGTLGTDVIYDHYRTMGSEVFSSFPWSMERVEQDLAPRRRLVEQIEACDRCGACEQKCPYGLSVITMLKNMVAPNRDILRIWDALQSNERS